MKSKGYLALIIFIMCTFVSGAYYQDYACLDLTTWSWVNEADLATISFLSLSCIPTGLTYAFRDFIQLYLGRRAAIMAVIAATVFTILYAAYAAPVLDDVAYKEILISGMVFLGIEGVDQLTYEWLERKKMVFWKRLAISGLASGLADAFLWKSYLGILEPLSLVVSGLVMFLPAFIIALFFIKRSKEFAII